MDFHQKTLLSDEFGIGFAGLILEEEFDAAQFADVSIALGDPQIYQDIRQRGGTQPDYLMWGADPNSPYYVVECKGSQTSRSTSFDQMRRGLEQVPSIVFGAGPRQVMTLVIATCMEEKRTTVFIVDPPPDERYHNKGDDDSDNVSERTGEWSWRIPNPEAFAKRTWVTQESSLLKWAGQYEDAARRDIELEPWRERPHVIPQNAPRAEVRTDVGTFIGTRNIAFPELGQRNIQIFTGVEEELFANLTERNPRAEEVAQNDQVRFRGERQRVRRESPFSSISPNGTCMIVEGL
ncbi:MAG: hypothetical protein WBX22_10255 [Silvibacterium sp.]